MRKKHKDKGSRGADSGLPVRPGLTPIDIQQKEFRQQFRGYHMADVDAFLDELTEELAAAQEEIRRLRERSAGPPPLGSAPAAAREEADRIVREAREEAARIFREASVAGSASGSGELVPFLTREREFLQTLAGTIQHHAETVKAMARAAAERTPPAAAEQPTVPEAAAEPAPEPAHEAAPERKEERAPADVGSPDAVGEDTAAMPAVATDEPAGSEPPARPSPAAEPRVIRVDEPDEPDEEEPAGTAAGRRDEPGSAPPEGSLRELFWGEEG